MEPEMLALWSLDQFGSSVDDKIERALLVEQLQLICKVECVDVHNTLRQVKKQKELI